MITAAHLHRPSIPQTPPDLNRDLPHRDALHVLLDWGYVTLSGQDIHLRPLPDLRGAHHWRAPLLPGRYNPLITEELHHLHLSRAAMQTYLNVLRGLTPTDPAALDELRRGSYLGADQHIPPLPPAPHPFDAALSGPHSHYLGRRLSLTLRAAARITGPLTPARVTSAARHLHAQLGHTTPPPSVTGTDRALRDLTQLGYLSEHNPSLPPLPDATHPSTLGRAPFIQFGTWTRHNLLYRTEVHTLDPTSLQLYRAYGRLTLHGHVPTIHTSPDQT